MVADLEQMPRVFLDIPDLKSLAIKLTEWEPNWADRRKFVRRELRPLMCFFGYESRWELGDSIEKRSGPPPHLPSVSPADPLTGQVSEPSPNDDGDLEISSTNWTGLPSVKEQARVVLRLAPAALEGVEALIREYGDRLHNAPPEAIDPEGLESLKALHTALGVLIERAEKGQPLEMQFDLIRRSAAKVFQFAGETGDLMLMGAKPALASLPLAWGTWALLSAICAPVTLATLGPAMVASVAQGYFGLAKPRPR